MVTRGFTNTPHYEQSIRGLHRLHEFIETGMGESSEADMVRDGLERPWMLLTETEKKRIDGLSEDLNSISEPAREIEPMNPQVQRKLVEAFEAQRAGEWDRALELLRCWGRYLDPALLSYLRGSVWQEAGDPATAVLFLQHAAQLAPDNWTYASLYLHELATVDPTDALRRASEILASNEANPLGVVVMAAGIQLQSTRGKRDADVRPVLLKLTRLLERTLSRMQEDEAANDMMDDSRKKMAIGLLASSYALLGDSRTAIRYYNLGLARDPNDEDLLVARGTVRYGVEPGAVGDFEQAIRCGSAIVWPYFFLAHNDLLTNRFDECRRMCERALELTDLNDVRGHLYEWLAISKAEMGFPPEQVRDAFETAIRHDPDVERIRRNFKTFEDGLSKGLVGERPWEKPAKSIVQSFGRDYQPPLAA